MEKSAKNRVRNISVVILAGGVGIQIGPNRDKIPKGLVDVNGTPILLHIMDHYARYGFTEFILCAGYGKELINEFVKQIPALADDVNKTVNETGIDRSRWVKNVLNRRPSRSQCDAGTSNSHEYCRW